MNLYCKIAGPNFICDHCKEEIPPGDKYVHEIAMPEEIHRGTWHYACAEKIMIVEDL